MTERVARADAVAKGALARAAWFGERSISVARMILTALVLVRFVMLGGARGAFSARPEALVGLGALALGLLASTAVLWKLGARPREVPRGLLVASVSLDALLCHLSLLPNTLWPDATFEGLLRMPDVAVILIALAAAGVRLDVGVAGLAVALHALSAAILLGVDATAGAARVGYGGKDVVLFSIYFVAAAIFALATARGVRVLATDSARAALVAQRARLGLRELLRDHHDVRSALSSAMVRVESLGGDADAAGDLRRDLEDVARLIGTTRDRAYKEMAELDAPETVDVPPVARSVVQVVTRRFPDVTFEMSGVTDGELGALVVGGAQGLARVLLNVLVNAREGDGTRGATRVEVHLWKGANSVGIRIRDDGPGFPEAVLAAAPGKFVSTKEEGSGIGMFLVASVVDASGGLLERRNAPRGGAEVVLTLPPA